MDRRLLTIRLLVALAIFWWLLPGCWWLWIGASPLALMMPTFLKCQYCFHSQYQIVVAGIANGTISACADCAEYNGTWTVSAIDCSLLDDTPSVSGMPAWLTGNCCAYYQINPCFCRATTLDVDADEKFATNVLTLFVNAASTAMFVAFQANGTGTDCHTINTTGQYADGWAWHKDYFGSYQDCGAFSSEGLLDFSVQTNPGCNTNSSTVAVTAI